MPVRNIRDGVLTIKDGTPTTPKSITIALEDESGLSWTENDPITEVKDRKVLSHMRKGEEQSVAMRLRLKFVEFIKQTGASDPTFYEAIRQLGGASTWLTTNTDHGDVYTMKWEFLIISPDSTEKDEVISFAKVKVTVRDFSEGADYNTLEATAIDFETAPTITKQAKV